MLTPSLLVADLKTALRQRLQAAFRYKGCHSDADKKHILLSFLLSFRPCRCSSSGKLLHLSPTVDGFELESMKLSFLYCEKMRC